MIFCILPTLKTKSNFIYSEIFIFFLSLKSDVIDIAYLNFIRFISL